MSFARAKITRFNERAERPSTATSSAGGVRNTSSTQKSFIPKFRSLSQPPSVHIIKDNSLLIGDQLKNISNTTSKEAIDEIEVKDHSVKSDEFKDCLDKPDAEGNSKDSPSDSKKEQTLTRKESIMSRRNSSSGIPVAVAGKSVTTPRMSPKPSPRINHVPSSSARKPMSLNASSENRSICTPKKNLELFMIKKKRFDQLKRDVLDKQKPLLDMYQVLQQLKKKLDESGKPVNLEPVKLVEFEDCEKPKPNLSGAGEVLLQKIELDPTLTIDIQSNMKEIPQGLVTMCKSLAEKHKSLIGSIEQLLETTTDVKDIKIEIEKLKIEDEEIESTINKLVVSQEQDFENLVGKWSQVLGTEQCELQELNDKMRKQESHLKEITAELNKTKQQLKEKLSMEQSMLEEENNKVRDKIFQLEKQIETERKKHLHEIEKYKTTEISVKTYKSKIKDFDSSKQQYDTKISQLQQELRNSQMKIKQMEKSYEKELVELNKSRHVDKAAIERLNKDRSTFETRLQTATDTIENVRNESLEREAAMRKELEENRNQAQIARSEVVQMKKECQLLQKEVNALEVQTQQAADVIHHKEHPDGTKLETERECELQIEVVAQRAAIRALHEKVDANTAEKLRFIETIEKMNGTPEGMNDTIVKALVKKEEEITRYHQILKSNEEMIVKLKIEVDTIRAKHDHLSQQLDSMTSEDSNDDLKVMLKEGKTKLEQAMMKSLENEHKIIKYEHELAQKNLAIANMDNMMKVKDGLIGVIKAKKDELAMENHSLTKYSEQIRSFVLESKEQLKEKEEIIVELQSAVTCKDKESRNLDKRLKELEEKLSLTNEKRYKLQDTVSYMEKELQNAKAQVNQYEDMQTRYDLGRISDITPSIGLQPWNATSALLHEQYKSAYEREQMNKQTSVTRSYQQIYKSERRSDPEDSPCKLSTEGNSMIALNPNNRTNPFLKMHQRSSNSVSSHGEGPKVCYTRHNLAPTTSRAFGSGNEYKPILFEGVDTYKVCSTGNLLWCRPSVQMHSNNVLITKDIIAQSCSKIRNKLDNSLQLLSGQEINFSDPGEGPVKIKITVV